MKETKACVLDSYHLGEVLKTSAKKLGERCGYDAVEMLTRRFTEFIGAVEEDKYSYIWRSAIEDHEQDSHKEGTRSVLVDAVRDAALGATALNTNSSEAQKVVELLLESPYPTLTRIGIYVCGEHYGNVGASFWTCVQENWFVDVRYWHELYWFIRKAFLKFSISERNQFLEIVDKCKGDWAEDSRRDEWDQTNRRDLLHPAYGLGDSEVDEKYQSLVEQWGPVRDHPDFHSYSTSGWVGERSPVASDALVGMSDEELVKLLKGFVPDSHRWDGPTYRGLASSITAAVRASEDGFARQISLFAELARPYQHGLLRGLQERWSDDKRDIDWIKTLSLIQTIVSSPTFKPDLESGKTEGWEPSVHWVVNDIADLIKGALGTERHLPTDLYKSCFEILHQVLDAIAPTAAEQSDDAVSSAINSARGRTLESFIYLALAMRREEVKVNPESCETWSKVGPVFDAELANSESGLNADFAAMCGLYCTNFHYINSQWTEANFDRLFSTSNEVAWKCAAQGFAYQHYMYDWLFNKLVIGGHLRRMVYTEGLPDHVADKALQFLGLAYLDGLEDLDGNGLLSELVTGLKVKELRQLCWFFWTLRGESEPFPQSAKILAFWLRVAKQVRSSRVDMPELQSALSQLATFVQELTPDIVEALREAAPHAQVGYHGYMLVENLARLVSRYPKEVASIFRAAMSGFLPDYDKDNVIRCVTGLADAGEEEEAEEICNAYANRGSTLLKDTYETLRARKRSH